MAGKIKSLLKALAGKNWNELYTLVLISLGLPYAVYIWTDWKAALTVFIVTQIALGILRERK